MNTRHLSLKTFQTGLFLILIFLFALFFAERISFVTADLGRHIKNGEVFAETHTILSTNYYSYTESNFPAINHHWGTGVVFYYLWKLWGFVGVSYFYITLVTLSFVLIFFIARRNAGFLLVSLFSLLALPLIGDRTELRPEGFSYLFIAIYYGILLWYSSREIRLKWIIWSLPVLQVLWVNLHIFFIFGPFLIGVFLMDCFIRKAGTDKRNELLFVFLLSCVVCVLNPQGLKGALVPLTIFKEYGYMLVENQSVWFMQKRFPGNMIYTHFWICLGVLILGIVLGIRKNNFKQLFVPVVCGMCFAVLGMKAIRGFPLFGFFFMICGSQVYQQWMDRRNNVARTIMTGGILLVVIGILGLITVERTGYYSLYRRLRLPLTMPEIQKKRVWFPHMIRNVGKLPGLVPGANRSAEFFKRLNLKGPIFNNYDIGGYLIFHLFPQERVFVDNRPEAYSTAFFQKQYIPMQEDEAVWKKFDQQYRFNVIYFYRLDLTPWAQPFLIRRLEDPLWAPVYVDDFTIILLKRNAENEAVIQQLELPKSIFQVRHEG
ncbi:MAG: hypothetical protein KC684_02250 [Candidatus Omnitrophica bacterium]|nr:hypothetical protein [Candidatus Omnitrophota bacterium]